ncbi:pantoate--beta-alanine ligase [Sulfuriflexus mobilis]|uniref:pantoate--beta-alanine ligase n=1 Tax=Sulfuriflexus mobilis TaxID=1811807 RepID=UPI000F840D72|nr:pantoate--beta-alanine ligase [Sulfuriflexus mobilis]
MKQFQDINALHEQLQAWRARGERIALVPTMGNLHEGHLCLVDEARRHAQRCLVSIFVNPTQFGPGEDLAAYPRTPEEDCALLESRGADAVFLPTVEVMYPQGEAISTGIAVPEELANILCGASRPGHFNGVATVVAKLFNLVQPEVAVFGEKDYQQLLVIRRLVADLNMPVTIIGLPTVREAGGLAMSSRNRYLDAGQRQQAGQLYASLEACCARLQAGDRDIARLEEQAVVALQEAGFEPDYVSVRRAADLGLPGSADRDLVILAAAGMGQARLIDNLRCRR